MKSGLQVLAMSDYSHLVKCAIFGCSANSVKQAQIIVPIFPGQEDPA
jgi:hypothetical protein